MTDTDAKLATRAMPTAESINSMDNVIALRSHRESYLAIFLATHELTTWPVRLCIEHSAMEGAIYDEANPTRYQYL